MITVAVKTNAAKQNIKSSTFANISTSRVFKKIDACTREAPKGTI